jgi:hypothetical protein
VPSARSVNGLNRGILTDHLNATAKAVPTTMTVINIAMATLRRLLGRAWSFMGISSH